MLRSLFTVLITVCLGCFYSLISIVWIFHSCLQYKLKITKKTKKNWLFTLYIFASKRTSYRRSDKYVDITHQEWGDVIRFTACASVTARCLWLRAKEDTAIILPPTFTNIYGQKLKLYFSSFDLFQLVTNFIDVVTYP